MAEYLNTGYDKNSLESEYQQILSEHSLRPEPNI